VLLAENGQRAVDLFSEYRRDIRLIILDLTMPVLNGEEALLKLREADPLIPIVLSSGYNQAEIVRRFPRQTVIGFIQKPYTVRQLNEAIAKALPDSIANLTQP
jgi:two-component system, cell cycle sensor histidine kinase and response regulator CckA